MLTALLTHADTLPFPGRMAWLAEHARALSPTDYADLHAALDGSSDSARHVGLHLAVVRRDLDAVTTALHDPLLRHRALAAAIRLPVSDAALVSVLDDAPQAVRFAVYGVLRRSRRRELADALVDDVRERHGVGDAERLLPACSPDVIARLLPGTQVSTTALRRLALTAPDAVLAHARERCRTLDDDRWRKWKRDRGEMLTTIAERATGSMLAALHQEPRLAGWGDDFGLFAALLTRPDLSLSQGIPATVGLGSTAGTPLPPRTRRALAALDQGQVVELAGMLPDFGVRELVLAAVRPEFRRAAVNRMHSQDRQAADIDLRVLLTVPRSDRADIARRILATDRVERRSDLIAFTAALPYVEARPVLVEAIGSAVADDRADAWLALLTCAAREPGPAAVLDALGPTGRVWRDRYRVWSPLLEVVAGLPARTLAALPVDHLHGAVDAAIGSLDSDTRDRLTRWCARTVGARNSPDDRALLARVVTERQGPLEDVTVTAARGLFEAVRSDHPTVLRLAEALGPRLAAAPELDDLVGDLAMAGDHDAVRCWTAAPTTKEPRVARLVAHDPALGLLDEVWPVVANRRTDLVDRLLEHAVAVPVIGRRWTDRQRARANALAEAVAGTAVRLTDRVAATRTITDPALLTALADTAPEAVAAAALTALAEHGDPEEVAPVLVRHSGRPAGAAARDAALGLRRLLARMPDSRAVQVLRAVLLEHRVSVGAAKQAVRVLAVANPSGAVDVLLDVHADPSTHRDVRAVVTAALVGHPDDPRVPLVLAEALRGPDAVRDAVLAAIPASPRVDHLRPLAELLAGALDSGHTKVITTYGGLWRHAPGGVDVLGRIASDTEDRGKFMVAADLLVRMSVTDRGLAVLRATLANVVRGRRGDDPTTWNDLVRVGIPPDGRTVDDQRAASIRLLADAALAAEMRGPTVKFLRALAVRHLVDPAVEVDLGLWDELVSVIDERPMRWTAWESRGSRWAYLPERVAAVVDHLAGLGGSVPGLIAVELVRSVGRSSREPPELDFWRSHPDPDVREAAKAG